ncbi:MAG: AMP-binding protein [Myxococcales bacterium]|nr:AMP-binding protein [Myxococcales bacterium]
MPTMFDFSAHGLSLPGRTPSIPGPGPQTVADVLELVLRADPDRPALVGRSGRLSYGELDAVVNATAGALVDLGVQPFERVAACLPNDLDVIVTMLAVQRLGGIWVGINRPLAPPEKAYLLSDSGARVMLAVPEVIDELRTCTSELSALRHLLPVDSTDGGAGSWAARVLSFAGASRPNAGVDSHGPAAIAYTSGTTGSPKGAVHSHHNLLLPGAVAAATGRYNGCSQGVVLALTMLNMQVLGPLTAFQDGARCIAIDEHKPVALAGWIRDEQVQNLCAVPTLLHDLLSHPDIDPADLASLVLPEVGGAVVPETFRKLYRERFGKGVSIGYGMTEAPTAVTWSDPEAGVMPGLCGRPLPQVEIQIRDDAGALVPPGSVGEICVAPAASGPFRDTYTPMIGYWQRPEATAEALRDGVYHTGDIGLLSEDGNLYLRGRRNELILRGGANVYPAEVERILGEHPDVAGSAVLGVEDQRLGERVVAAVELKAGQRATPQDLIEHVSGHLARYKVPAQVAIVERLPRNTMGKVVKHQLRPLFQAPGAVS